MIKEINKAWPSSLVNKKTAFWIIGIFIFFFGIYILISEICVPCTYQYNNRDYVGVCTKECVSVHRWKFLFFNLTGKNLDYVEKPSIHYLNYNND